MHRYVDLHYQYLTGSYACMLSCPISLRPFVILEATGPGPRGAQGQRDGGCRQHPCGGSDTWRLYAAHERSQDKQTKVIIMGFTCCPGRTMIFFFYNKKKKKALCLLSIPACKHMFLRFAKALRGSASGFHLLGITLWMSLWRYMFLFVSLWKKRMSS